MRLLYLAFVDAAYTQLFVKIKQQFQVFKKLNSDSHCCVIGVNGGQVDMDAYEFEFIDLAGYTDSSQLRSMHFLAAEKVIERLCPDIIYFRYPFFDPYTLEFVLKFDNVVFEIQSIAANEVSPGLAAIELEYGPKILGHARGIVAVTNELLQYELSRSPRSVPGYVVSNGISPESLGFARTSYRSGETHILCAAHFSPWHGIDRLIRGFMAYESKDGIIIHLAGEGEELAGYFNLVQQAGLTQQVLLHGKLNKRQLDKLSSYCQVGIGSLGLHRLGLNELCILKNREYCLRGIPFVYAGNDVDFTPDLPFLRVFPATDDPVDFSVIMELARKVEKQPEIRLVERSYAIKYLSWEVKLPGLVAFLARLSQMDNGGLADSVPVADTIPSPLVSVIIPCYNQACYLPDAISSVVAQTYTAWECIVVNDGSPDDTSEVARRLIVKHAGKQIRLLEKLNGGLSDARNHGIAAAKGTYILPLDADDILHPEMLAETVAYLEAHQEISIVYTDLIHFGAENRHVVAGEYNFAALRYANQLNYCSLYRRPIWKNIGGYNRNMTWGYEDWDFWLSCGEHGYVAQHLPKALLYYRVKHESMLTKAREHEAELMSQIILNHPKLYGAEERQLAAIFQTLHRGRTAPLVSVIVPTYNRPKMLQAAIQSILNQTFHDFEILVVNDAGQDVTAIIAACCSSKIRCLTHETNKGLAAARNTGIRAARGKYIAYLDDDDRYYPDHLEILVSHLESTGHPVAYTEAYRVYQQVQGEECHVITKDIPYRYDFDIDEILVDNCTPVLCVMHRRDCLDVAGAFDESLQRLEDWDLWIRLSRHYQFDHIRKTTCEFSHRLDESTMSSSNPFHFLASYRQVCHKHRKDAEGKPWIQRMQKKVEWNFIYAGYEYVEQQVAPLLMPAPHGAAAQNSTLRELQAKGITDQQIAAVAARLTALGVTCDDNKTVSLLREALQYDPDYLQARFDLISILLKAGELDEVAGHLQLLLAMKPGDPDLSCALADMYITLGQEADAVDILRTALAADKDNPELLKRLGRRVNLGPVYANHR